MNILKRNTNPYHRIKNPTLTIHSKTINLTLKIDRKNLILINLNNKKIRSYKIIRIITVKYS